MMLGERTGKRYRLGDRVRIKVMRADIETSKIDFSLVEDFGAVVDTEAPKKKTSKSRTGARKK
jgi:ribonuclease R